MDEILSTTEYQKEKKSWMSHTLAPPWHFSIVMDVKSALANKTHEGQNGEKQVKDLIEKEERTVQDRDAGRMK